VELAIYPAWEVFRGKLSYVPCGVDEDGNELYVSSWLDLRTVLREVEHVSEELKARGKTCVVARDVKARVVDQLLQLHESGIGGGGSQFIG
jgi:hypothetical protein